MANAFTVDISTLHPDHRRALEEILGRELTENQQLQIDVIDGDQLAGKASRPVQDLDDLLHIYDGLTDEEIDAIDAIIKTRANFTRNVPR